MIQVMSEKCKNLFRSFSSVCVTPSGLLCYYSIENNLAPLSVLFVHLPDVMISYDKFWQLLLKRHISQYRLTHYFHFSSGRLYTMRHNGYVRTSTIDKLCAILNCRPADLMEQKPDHEISKAVQHYKRKQDFPGESYEG